MLIKTKLNISTVTNSSKKLSYAFCIMRNQVKIQEPLFGKAERERERNG